MNTYSGLRPWVVSPARQGEAPQVLLTPKGGRIGGAEGARVGSRGDMGSLNITDTP